MTAKTLVTTVLSFLAHYAEEAAAVSTGFNSLIDALPLSAQDKVNIRETLKPVFDAPTAIADALKAFEEDGEPVVHIAASDIQNAVASFLSTALPGAVATYMHDHPAEVPPIDGDALDAAVAAYFAAHPPVVPAPADTGGGA